MYILIILLNVYKEFKITNLWFTHSLLFVFLFYYINENDVWSVLYTDTFENFYYLYNLLYNSYSYYTYIFVFHTYIYYNIFSYFILISFIFFSYTMFKVQPIIWMNLFLHCTFLLINSTLLYSSSFFIISLNFIFYAYIYILLINIYINIYNIKKAAQKIF